jgi:hypothetical protein
MKIDKSDDSSGTMIMPVKGKYFAYAYKNASTMPSGAAAFKGGGKNTGVDTLEEAESEYTEANGYFDGSGVYSLRKVTAKTLGDLNGKWVFDEDEDYYIEIRGSAYLEYYDGGFEGRDDAVSRELYDIVECSGASAASGIMYMKVAQSIAFTPGNYVALGWLNKGGGIITFARANDEYTSLDAVKAAKTDPASAGQFPAPGNDLFNKVKPFNNGNPGGGTAMKKEGVLPKAVCKRIFPGAPPAAFCVPARHGEMV